MVKEISLEEEETTMSQMRKQTYSSSETSISHAPVIFHKKKLRITPVSFKVGSWEPWGFAKCW